MLCVLFLSEVKEQGADNSRVDSVEPQNASAEQNRPESMVNMGTSSEPPTMSDTLELLLKRLKDKRQEANRSDEINVSSPNRGGAEGVDGRCAQVVKRSHQRSFLNYISWLWWVLFSYLHST